MDTNQAPRKTKLYNELAKDFNPKEAFMKVCRYIEGMERRIKELEEATSEEKKSVRKTVKKESEE